MMKNLPNFALLAAIIVVVFFLMGQLFQVQRTKVLLNNTAESFVYKEMEVVHQWVRGEIRDPWQKSIYMTTSVKDLGIQFASSGPDRQPGTTDDILGEFYAFDAPGMFAKLIGADENETFWDLLKQ